MVGPRSHLQRCEHGRDAVQHDALERVAQLGLGRLVAVVAVGGAAAVGRAAVVAVRAVVLCALVARVTVVVPLRAAVVIAIAARRRAAIGVAAAAVPAATTATADLTVAEPVVRSQRSARACDAKPEEHPGAGLAASRSIIFDPHTHLPRPPPPPAAPPREVVRRRSAPSPQLPLPPPPLRPPRLSAPHPSWLRRGDDRWARRASPPPPQPSPSSPQPLLPLGAGAAGSPPHPVERANVRTVHAVAPRAGAHTRGKARSIIKWVLPSEQSRESARTT
jgi:hypothetical protein